jgi:hypothetical protein
MKKEEKIKDNKVNLFLVKGCRRWSGQVNKEKQKRERKWFLFITQKDSQWVSG